MAGNLIPGLGANAGVGPGASGTYFTTVGIGSGHSLGGGNYPDGTVIRSMVYQTVSTSTVTVIGGSNSSTQTFTTAGFGPGDFVDSTISGSLPQGIVSTVYFSAASQITVSFMNTSSTVTTSVPTTSVIVELVKIAP